MTVMQNIDYSANESEWSQTELRFSSDFDGKFNFTAGYYYNETVIVKLIITLNRHNVLGRCINGPLCYFPCYM